MNEVFRQDDYERAALNIETGGDIHYKDAFILTGVGFFQSNKTMDYRKSFLKRLLTNTDYARSIVPNDFDIKIFETREDHLENPSRTIAKVTLLNVHYPASKGEHSSLPRAIVAAIFRAKGHIYCSLMEKNISLTHTSV